MVDLARIRVLSVGVALLLAACGSSATSIGTSVASQAAATAAPATAGPAATRSADPTAPIPARGARLIGPTGLVFDAAGNLFVSGCTWTSSYIYRIDPQGMLTTFAGAGPTDFEGDDGPAAMAHLQCPVGMAIGPDRSLYFADHASNRIRRIDSSGIITTVAGSGAAGVDQGSFAGDGGQATQATLQEPWTVAFDTDGNLYIGDRDNYRVRRVDPKGMITTVAGVGHTIFAGDGGPAIAATMCPHGVLIDDAGDLVISDPCNHRVRRVDARGIITTIVGTGAAGFSGDGGPAVAALVDAPDFMALDDNDRLYVETGLQIRRVDARGIITTVAGIGRVGRPDDGMPALEAPFPDLYGVAVSNEGDVFVADGNETVYRIATSGILTVFAGTVD